MGPIGALLDHSWLTLGALMGALERSWSAFGALLERSWGDHDRSWDRLDDFGPPMGRFWTLQPPILSIRSPILGSQRIDFAVSAKYACDSASNIEFRMICFRFSLELLHETRNANPTFVDVPCSAAVRAQHMELMEQNEMKRRNPPRPCASGVENVIERSSKAWGLGQNAKICFPPARGAYFSMKS